MKKGSVNSPYSDHWDWIGANDQIQKKIFYLKKASIYCGGPCGMADPKAAHESVSEKERKIEREGERYI